ncbi:MAG: FAD-dependent thymidylate synthase [Thermodesulfobacteriota bacterium]
MAVATLRIRFESESVAGRFFETRPRFLHVDRPEKDTLLVTGSVRAWREHCLGHPGTKVAKAAAAFLARHQPLLFGDLVPKRGAIQPEGVAVEKVPLPEVDALPADLLGKHRHLGVRFIVNRAVTHEIVRHRPCSFLQESQRYCRYADDRFGNEVTFIAPLFFAEGSPEYTLWAQSMAASEASYLRLLATTSPQAARTVLPNSCKTELIVYCNLLEWLHILKLRTSAAAEPSMREIMIPLLAVLRERFPGVFGALPVPAV